MEDNTLCSYINWLISESTSNTTLYLLHNSKLCVHISVLLELHQTAHKGQKKGDIHFIRDLIIFYSLLNCTQRCFVLYLSLLKLCFLRFTVLNQLQHIQLLKFQIFLWPEITSFFKLKLVILIAKMMNLFYVILNIL
jgi:hypothetical protein